jgi:Tc toxin complex TcA C-terminal TcB-binding domain/Putative peptidoglycan binding domain/Repeat of unknown function (DUF5648)
MQLQGRELSIEMRGEDVRLLHSELGELGYAIPSTDLERNFFGPGTYKIVREFQQSNGLPVTGVINDRTAEVINALVDRLRSQFVVKGNVTTGLAETVPSMRGVTVRAFDRDLRSEQLLGEAVTNANADYEISYTAEQFRRSDKRTADLFLRVFSPQGTPLKVLQLLFNDSRLTSSDIIFNAPREATVNILVEPLPILSEYEQLLAFLESILEGIQPADLTNADIEFLVRETSTERRFIEYLVQGAKLGRETDLPTEVFYGFARRELPLNLDRLLDLPSEQLRNALEAAIRENIIPARLRESLDEIIRRFEQLRRERDAREEQNRIPHEVMGQLLNQETDEPLFKYWVHAVDLDAANRDLGYVTTDAKGLFSLTYTTPPHSSTGEETAIETRRLQLHIATPERNEIYQTEVQIEVDRDQTLTVRIPVPAPPDLTQLAESLQLPLPARLLPFLAERGIRTLADIRRAGGIRQLENLPVAPDDLAVQTLEAHANLNLLSDDIRSNAAIITRGYTSISAIASATRPNFVGANHADLGDFKPAQLQVAARAQIQTLNKILMERQIDPANGSSSQPLVQATKPAPSPNHCSCKNCEAAVSPIAYLADLLDYAINHLKDNNAAISLNFLTDNFHQPFGDLLTSCTETDRQLRQVRLCIEVLRRLSNANTPDNDYLQKAYTDLLTRIGTSYEEMSQIGTANQKTRRDLTSRLGIVFDPVNTLLEKLLLDLQANPAAPNPLTEAALQRLFGLAQTLVEPDYNPLSDGIKSGNDQNQIRRWNLEGADWQSNTDPDGLVYVSLTKTASSAIRVEVYRDLARTQLVAAGEQAKATDPVALVAVNNSGLSGRLELNYSADTTDIELRVFPQLLSWRLAFLRTLWAEGDRPINSYTDRPTNPDPEAVLPILPIIDPDVIGPDDFRYPVASAGANKPFDLWIKRRKWVDQQLDGLKQVTKTMPGVAEPAPDLNKMLGSMYQPITDYPTPGSPPIVVWKTTIPLTDFDSLLEDLGQKGQKDTAQAAKRRIETDLHLTAESFTQLMGIRAKKDEPNQKITDEEWQDVDSILVQARKVSLFETWRNEENAQPVSFGSDQFWLSLRSPKEGNLPPIIQPSTPLIDPETLKLNDLPEPTASRKAIALWYDRKAELDQITKTLKATYKTNPNNGFNSILKQALNRPSNDPLLLELDNKLSSNIDIENTKKRILEELFMPSVEAFSRLMEIKTKNDDPSPQKESLTSTELNEVYAILTSIQKKRTLFSPWVQLEKTTFAEISFAPATAAYWRALKVSLPKWRAPAETRQQWRQALRARSQSPIIDPDLLINPQTTIDSDLKNPAIGDPAFDLWQSRYTWINTRLSALEALRTAPAPSLDQFNAMLIQSLFGDERFGLTPTALADSVMQLDRENREGKDITARLEQLGLTYSAFSNLVKVHQVAASNAAVTDSGWETVKNILVQCEKRRIFSQWRDQEKEKNITLGPDYFKFPKFDLTTFPPPKTFLPIPWRSTLRDRQDWQDTLQSRIDQQQTVIQALQEAVSATEAATLPDLRDRLILASSAPGNTLDEKAKWMTDHLLIDAKAGSCQKTTRIAQAIETVQQLLFSVRTAQLKDTYPKLVLDADEFEAEWQWIGSYATWRAAMFVFLYPQNILIPSLRKWRTPAFSQLVKDLRTNRRLTPEQACQAAKSYSDYFRDVCNLTMGASCQARTHIHKGEDCQKRAVPNYRYLLYMFAQGKTTQKVYWSAYDPEDETGYAQTFWAEVPGLKETKVLHIIGAVQYNLPDSPQGSASKQQFIYLFAQTEEKGNQKIVFVKYDLEQERWDDSPTYLDPPDKAMGWTAALKQTASTTQPPHLAIRLGNGAICDRQLNPEGSNWEEQKFRTLIDAETGTQFNALHAMVEYEETSFYLFVSGNDGMIWYKLFRFFDIPIYRLQAADHFYTTDIEERDKAVKDDGYNFEGIAGYIGAAKSAGTTALYHLYSKENSDHLYTTDIEERNNAINNLKYEDKGILGYLNTIQVSGTVPLHRLYNKTIADHLYTTNSKEVLDAFNFGYAYEYIVGYITNLDWKILSGQWVGALCWNTGSGIYIFWRSSSQTSTALLTETFGATVSGVLTKVKRLAPHSGPSEAFQAYGSRHFVAYNQGRDVYRSTLVAGFGYPVSQQQTALVAPSTNITVKLASSVFGASTSIDIIDIYAITEHLSESERQTRRSLIAYLFDANSAGPQTNLTYLKEAYFFVAIHLALQLQAAGQYIPSLDWFRTIYDYSLPVDQRKVYYGLILEESLSSAYQRNQDWLLDPLNPHTIAEGRSNTYNRFTVQAIIRCLLDFADAEFTRDTAESVPRARTLYLKALELLNDTPELQQKLDTCENLIGELEISVGVHAQTATWTGLKHQLANIFEIDKLKTVINEVKQVLTIEQPWEIRLERAKAIVSAAQTAQPATPTLATVVTERPRLLTQAHETLVREPAISEVISKIGVAAGKDFLQAVSSASNVPTAVLEREKVDLSWLRYPLLAQTSRVTTVNTARETASVSTDNSLMMTASRIPSVAGLSPPNPLDLTQQNKKPSKDYTPLPTFRFCIPPNPILRALRLHAELNLYKLRTCRNIAGQERQLEPYAAPTDTVSGLPSIGAGGQLLLPGIAVLRPTPYRYTTLIERAKQLVQLAAQIEATLLSALEKRDAEAYNLLKARQDIRLTRAQVRLQDLRVREAEDGVTLAELQQKKAQDQFDHYTNLVNEGMSNLETAAVLLQLEGIIHLHIAAALKEAETFGVGGIGDVGNALIATASLLQTQASYERRKQEWEFQKILAQDDIQIGTQQVRIANDQVRVVGEERNITQLQSEHAEAIVDFLSNKFTNVELYDWMSDVLEGVYSFFLQQATAVAKLAESQLAFERQEVPPAYIQADYWEAPTDIGAGNTDGKAPDRRGLTGSARLLQDIYQLDQYAFDTNKRKLQLTKTISLAQLSPAEFQRFLETGIMLFAHPMEMFDRNFPGHYLRLIKRVRTSVIALIPPTQGIHATLSTTGTSRVVIGGDIFQTVIIRRPPESVALTTPQNATGLFELDLQPENREMLLPFEGLGVDTAWELRMPKAANLFDYSTIADVLIAIEYTALNSFDYRQQVIQTLKPNLSADRPFSFRNQFADQWYDLNNPEQTKTPMKVKFQTVRGDFPPNVETLKIQQVLLYFVRASQKTFELPITTLRFTEQGNQGTVGGSATPIDSIISTRRGNAGSWTAMIGKTPVGDWELTLPNTEEVKKRFQDEEIDDILFVITYSGRTPEWPM